MVQNVVVYNNIDPLTTKKVQIKTARGEKIMCTDDNVSETYLLYEQYYAGSTKDKLSSKNFNGNCTLDCKVISMSSDEAFLDAFSKETIYINLKKEDPRYVEDIQIGQTLTVFIKPRKPEKSLEATYSGWVEKEKIRQIIDTIGDKKTAYEATVEELIHGGYYLRLDGIRVFMPGSLGGMNKLHDFDTLIGKKMIVMPVNYSTEKETIVVSHREYLKTMLPIAIDNLKNNLEQTYNGHVTGTIKNGVFVEFNECLTGLISVSDLDDEHKLLFDNRQIKAGDCISFKIKQVVSDTKIALTQKESLSEAWDRAEETYPPSTIIESRVTKITNYGAFVELEKGISGLLYTTEFKKDSIKEGDMIKVQIQKIDSVNKKVNLKLVS